jgi:hypothetical protein
MTVDPTLAPPAPRTRLAAPRVARRWTIAAFATAGTCFALFPVLRPWPDEGVATPALAAAFASDRWVAAHLCGILAIALVAPAVLGLRRALGVAATTSASRLLGAAVLCASAGVVLSALYFGAETFGIQAVAAASVAPGAPTGTTFLDTVAAIRTEPTAMALFGAGLVLLAAAGVLVALALRHTSWPWAGLLFAAGLVLLLPQFWGGPGLRIAHGVLLGAGCLLLAVVAARATTTSALSARGIPGGRAG